jgi:hypothetical protein
MNYFNFKLFLLIFTTVRTRWLSLLRITTNNGDSR